MGRQTTWHFAALHGIRCREFLSQRRSRRFESAHLHTAKCLVMALRARDASSGSAWSLRSRTRSRPKTRRAASVLACRRRRCLRHRRVMTSVSGLVVVRPRCRQVPFDATRCHQTPSARPGIVSNTFLAPGSKAESHAVTHRGRSCTARERCLRGSSACRRRRGADAFGYFVHALRVTPECFDIGIHRRDNTTGEDQPAMRGASARCSGASERERRPMSTSATNARRYTDRPASAAARHRAIASPNGALNPNDTAANRPMRTPRRGDSRRITTEGTAIRIPAPNARDVLAPPPRSPRTAGGSRMRLYQVSRSCLSRYSWMSRTQTAPSPAADATRLTDPWRASPMAKTPDMVVSNMSGARPPSVSK